MNRRIVIIGIIVAVALAFLSVGFAAWGIVGSQSNEANGDFVGYTVIDLDKITNSAPAFYYNSSGFYNNGYSYETSFDIRINAPEKNEPYNLTITLKDQDNFLSTAEIVSSSNRNDETGDKVIVIENINSAISFDVSYSILSDDSNYSSIYNNLSSKTITLNITATTANGSWTVDKNINLFARIQNLVLINKPDPDTTIFTYTGGEQTYSVAENSGYTVTGNVMTNAGTQTVTISLNDGYAWSDNSQDNLEYTFTINKATPILYDEIIVTYPDNRDYAITSDLGEISITGIFKNSQSIDVDGSISLDGVSNLVVGTSNYNYVFIPTDTSNYNNAYGLVDLVVYATVRFVGSNEIVVQTQYVSKNSSIQQMNIPILSDNDCKTYFSNLLTYDLTPHFNNWINFDSSTIITDDLDVYANIVQITRSYNINIYYKDRDNQVSLVKRNEQSNASSYSTTVFDFSSQIGVTSYNNYAYGTNITLEKQIRIYTSTYALYYMTSSTSTVTVSRNNRISAFYMSPVSTFDWSKLANGNNASSYSLAYNEYLINVNNDTITILVLCIQPQAIVSTAALKTSNDFNYTGVTYYANMNDAFNACRNVSTNTYLWIVGQGRTRTTATGTKDNYQFQSIDCYTSNTTIASYQYSIDGITFTIPSYTLNVSGYTLSSDFTIGNKLTVNVVYDRGCNNTDYYAVNQNNISCPYSSDGKSYSYVNTYSSTQAFFIIPSGKRLTINGKLNVGGYLNESGSSVYAHGVIMNNGTIIANNGARINSFGYIKGSGSLEAKNGAVVIDVFKVYNWPGGANALGMYNKNIFPFDCYSFHNISCETIINYGSYYKGWMQLYMASSWTTEGKEEMIIVGPGGLFELTNSDGYIIKKVEDTTSNTQFNTSITSSNQNETQREIVEIYGNFKDNSMSITVKVLVTTTVSTSTDMALPIGFMKLKIMSGSGTLSNNSFYFLPGSSLFIDSGASITSSAGVIIAFFDEKQETYTYTNGSTVKESYQSGSYGYIYLHRAIYDSNNGYSVKTGYNSTCIVNGSLTVNGYISGKIYSNAANAFLKITNGSVTVKQMTALEYGRIGGTATVTNTTKYPQGYMLDDDSISNISAGTYISMESQNSTGTYKWNTSDSVVIITYNANGGTLTGNSMEMCPKTNGSYTVLSINTTNPVREHYSFNGWYTDTTYNTPVVGQVLTTNQTIYAKWTPINYLVDFEYIYSGCISSGSVNESGLTNHFDIEHAYSIGTPVDGTLGFGGWFVDSNCTISIDTLSVANLDSYIENNTVTIYGLWYSSLRTINITINHGINNDISLTNSSVVYVSPSTTSYSYSVNNIKDGNNTIITDDYRLDDSEYEYYFIGYYTDSSYNTPYNGTFSFSEGTGTLDLTIYAKWFKKIQINIIYNGQVRSTENLVPPSTSETMSLETAEVMIVSTAHDLTGNNYRFNSWSATYSGTNQELYNSSTNELTIPTIPGVTINLTANLVQLFTITQASHNNGATVDITTSAAAGEIVSYKPVDSDGINAVYIYATSGGSTSNYYIKNTSVSSNSTYNFEMPSYDVTIYVDGKSGECLLPGTKITLADGTYKNVEDILPTDLLLAFDHESGKIISSPIFFQFVASERETIVTTLIFDNGKEIKIVTSHGFYDIYERKYIKLTSENYFEYIGHSFYTGKIVDGVYNSGSSKLIGGYNELISTAYYSPVTLYHFNSFTEDFLSVPDDHYDLINYWDYNDDLTIDQESKENYIEQFGLLTYDELSSYMSFEVFDNYHLQYLPICYGRGYMTDEKLMYLILKYVPMMEDYIKNNKNIN